MFSMSQPQSGVRDRCRYGKWLTCSMHLCSGSVSMGNSNGSSSNRGIDNSIRTVNSSSRKPSLAVSVSLC